MRNVLPSSPREIERSSSTASVLITLIAATATVAEVAAGQTSTEDTVSSDPTSLPASKSIKLTAKYKLMLLSLFNQYLGNFNKVVTVCSFLN